MIRIVVICDVCAREAHLPAGRAPEDLGDYAGWRVVRDEAVCPACLARPVPRGPGLRLRGREP